MHWTVSTDRQQTREIDCVLHQIILFVYLYFAHDPPTVCAFNAPRLENPEKTIIICLFYYHFFSTIFVSRKCVTINWMRLLTRFGYTILSEYPIKFLENFHIYLQMSVFILGETLSSDPKKADACLFVCNRKIHWFSSSLTCMLFQIY